MSSNKFVSLDALKFSVKRHQKSNKVVGLCHGTFDLLHIGHIKHFSEAKSKCDILIVTLTPDKHIDKGPGRPLFNEDLRSEAIGSLECVDFVAINNWSTAIELLNMIKPNIYFKGIDYAEMENDVSGNIILEKETIESCGGMIYFTSSQKFSSSNIIMKQLSNFDETQIAFIEQIKSKYNSDYYYDLLKSFSQMSVVLVGELIIDSYIYCESVGKSGKESMLVNRITGNQDFLGGVGALARICSNIVSKIDVLSYLGEKEEDIDFIMKNYPSNGEIFYICKKDSPTIKKTRYVNDYTNSKLIGFYEINDDLLNVDDENGFNEIISKHVENHDIVIEVDYGHGLISRKSQNNIREKAKFLAANSQINSFNARFHDLSYYKDLDLLCINETELYSHYRTREVPIEKLMLKLKSEINCVNLITTRGSKGSIGIDAESNIIHCPSYAKEIIDRVGAGDAYLAAASIALGAGAPLITSMFIASILAGKVVGDLGTGSTIHFKDLWKTIEALLK